MKKLLSLLGVVCIVTSTAETSAVVLSDKNNSANTVHKALSSTDLSESSNLAKALILRNQGDYSIDSTSDVISEKDPNFLNSLNNTFGVHNYRNNNFIGDSSQIKYQQDDSNSITDTNDVIKPINIGGNSFSIDQLASMVNEFFQGGKDANFWINGILGSNIFNFANMLGQSLTNVLGKNNTLSCLITMLINQNLVQKFIGILSQTDTSTSFNNVFKDQTYNQAFDNMNNDLKTVFTKIIQNGSTLNVNDITNIANYFILIFSYVSQFNFSPDGQIGSHLFDASKTNKEYLEGISNTTIKAIPTNGTILDVLNIQNVQNLISNIQNYSTNNGIGMAQLIYVLMGDSNNLVQGSNSTDLVDLEIVPGVSNNPLNKTFGTSLNFLIGEEAAKLLKQPSSVVYRLVCDTDLGGQILKIVSGLLSDIVQNQMITIPLDYIQEISTLIQDVISKFNITTLSQENTAILKSAGNVLSGSNINIIFKIVNNVFKTLKSNNNIASIDDSFTPTSLNSGNFNVSYSLKMQNMPQKSGVSLFDNIWNGNYTTTPEIQELLSAIGPFIGVPELATTSLKNEFGLILNTKFFGTTLNNTLTQVNNILEYIKSNEGTIDSIIHTVATYLEQFFNTFMSSTDPIGKSESLVAANTYKELVTSDGQNDPEIKKLLTVQKGQTTPTALSYIAAISVASYKNEINNQLLKEHNKTVDDAILNILRGEDYTKDSDDVATNSTMGYLNSLYAKAKSIITDYFKTITEFLDAKEVEVFQNQLMQFNYYDASSEPIIINNSYEYVYKLNYTDVKTNKETTYEVKLDEQNANISDINDVYYKMTILNSN